ncbi:major histocompatibility complex class I-related gene protein-like [Oreochromis niloticus]|uniref:major histocompatibility complex class I-related gene protein-like n=1 Tax=Oreochromis niloticus TaxID=8128 RepID=UPI000DF43271|nr:major histocompatibility complex class I-related gene protein-like [Oreochromis niloticus]
MLTVNSATHSLIYIYTALSADLGLPGVHKFTAIGLLDSKPFDRFDTDNPRKTPTTNWARQHLTTEYLDKGTQSRLSKQQWFGVNLDVVMTRMGHSASDGDVHVLQWLHGCYEETNPSEERLRFVRGVDKYAYDGDDLMSFDYVTLGWSAATEVAKPIADKWNGVTVLTEYTNGYLRDECIGWLTRFVGHSQRELRERAIVPDVYVFARKTRGPILTLICMASGFSTNTPAMTLMRNGRVLSTDDGLEVFDILPNNDDTFQRRIAVDILQSDKGNFTCNVLEEDTGYHAIKHWRLEDRKTLRAVAWSNIVLLWALLLFSTMVFLCTAALYPVVVCIIRKQRTGQIANQTDSCAQHHGLKDETSGV